MLETQKSVHRIATIVSLVIIFGGILLIIYLGKLTAENNAIIADYKLNMGSNTVNNIDLPHTTSDVEATQPLDLKMENEEADLEVIETFETVLGQIANDDLNATMELPLQQIIESEYQADLLAAQPDILEAIENQNLDTEVMGALFLPQQPSQYLPNSADTSNRQLDVPLILQKDPEWGELNYGSNGTRSLAENGCAIVSLAMVDAYLSGEEVTPKDVLDWSGQDYYVHNQGTSWQIFYDYALDHGLNFLNHGANFATAMDAVQNGEIVIASVEPGYFTEVIFYLL